MRQAIIFFVLLLRFASSAAGTTELAFMEVFPGSRYAAMGGALTGLPGEPDTVFFSPSSLCWSSGTFLNFSHTEYFAGARYETVTAMRQMGNSSALGISAMYLWTGTQERRDGFGVSEGGFSPFQAVPVLSIAQGLSKTAAAGLNIKFPYENLDESCSFHVLYDVSGFVQLSDNISFGACLVNAGTYPGLPEMLRAGLGVSASGFKADIDAELSNEYSPVYSAGISVKPEEFLALMFGYRYDTAAQYGLLNCVSFGLELNVSAFSLTYGAKLNDMLGNTHYVSLFAKLN